LKFIFPSAVQKILNKMSENGFACYLVGGCVRDLLMLQTPFDYDFVTDRRPGEIISAAEEAGWKVWTQGSSWGVINLIVDGSSFEVATMRSESYGADPHRPEKVAFLNDIFSDLSRRDFTINAMAMDASGEIIDPFGGWEDLERKVVRCVGKPRERFLEDPLRLLRAARFIARTGFDIHHDIVSAIKDKEVHKRFKVLSVERVRDELEKILVSQMPSLGLEMLVKTGALEMPCTLKAEGEKIEVPFLPEISSLYGIKQNPRYHCYDVLEHTFQTVNAVSPSKILRWAALLHDIAKGAEGVRCYNSKGEVADYGHAKRGEVVARNILQRLKTEGTVFQRVPWLVKHHMDLNFIDENSAIRWAKKCARDFPDRQHFMEAVHQLIQLSYADDKARGMHDKNDSFLMEMNVILEKVLEKMVLYPEELKISGAFIAEKMGQGPQVGKVLQDLLVDVQVGRLQNSPQDLQDAVLKKLWRKSRKIERTL